MEEKVKNDLDLLTELSSMTSIAKTIELKEKKETIDIPVIFLTAKTDTEDIVKGFELGGVDYITKPFKKEELFARVNNHIRLKRIKDLLKENVDKIVTSDKVLVRLITEITDIVNSNN